MEFGKVNLRCLELLDTAHTQYFGDPVPTKVSLAIKQGPAIIVSGHDLPDLEELLKQTEGRGIKCIYAWRDASCAWLSRIE